MKQFSIKRRVKAEKPQESNFGFVDGIFIGFFSGIVSLFVAIVILCANGGSITGGQ